MVHKGRTCEWEVVELFLGEDALLHCAQLFTQRNMVGELLFIITFSALAHAM